MVMLITLDGVLTRTFTLLAMLFARVGSIRRMAVVVATTTSAHALLGGAGDDSLAGGPGDNTLDGGPDTDICTQGPGTGLITHRED